MRTLQFSKKIESTSSGRQTRSKTKGKEEFVQVPWLSHAMMILTTEWAGQKERDAQNDEDYEDEDDEDYDSQEYDGGRVEELNLGLTRSWHSGRKKRVNSANRTPCTKRVN